MHGFWKRRFERAIPMYADGLLSDSKRRRFERELAANEALAEALRRYERLMGTVKRLQPKYPPRAKWQQFLPDLRRRIELADMEQPSGWYARLIRRLYNRLESPIGHPRPRWIEQVSFGIAGAALGAAAAFYIGHLAPLQNGGDRAATQTQQAEQTAETGEPADNNLAFEDSLVEDFGGPYHIIADPNRE